MAFSEGMRVKVGATDYKKLFYHQICLPSTYVNGRSSVFRVCAEIDKIVEVRY